MRNKIIKVQIIWNILKENKLFLKKAIWMLNYRSLHEYQIIRYKYKSQIKYRVIYLKKYFDLYDFSPLFLLA